MRIAHIDTERTWRGGENQVLLLMRGLRERGHENFAVVRTGSALAQRAKEAGFKIFEINPWGEWDFIAAHRLNRWAKKEKIDVLHGHSSHGLGLAAFASVGTSLPVVVTRRVDFFLNRNPFSRWKYRRARKIIAISHGVQSVLLKSGIPSPKISLVPSGVDLTWHKQVKKADRREMGVPSAGPVIGQVAALAPHKDQATLLRAFGIFKKSNPLAHLVLVGEGSLLEPLKKLTSELGISDSVHFLGFQQDPLRFTAAMDVFCLSSVEEGLGTSLIDAMALGIPVVATNVGGIPDLIQDNQTGFLCEANNPQTLAEKIEIALVSRLKTPHILKQAEARALQFDVQMTVKLTESVYQSMI